MKLFFNPKVSIPLSLFAFAFLLIPVSHFKGLNLMPGDIGDARLNNYFLENVYQFLKGNSESLWHLPFFNPFPYALGFSDNLFGSSPVYLLARLININSDTAFQVWFLFGYVANFLGAYYALRRLNGTAIAASVGALIFTFGLPTSAHMGHAQLHYRFALPLAIVFFADFVNTKSWRFLMISVAWLVWQFYTGIYVGFFTLLMMATLLMTFLGQSFYKSNQTAKSIFQSFVFSWQKQLKNQKIAFFLGLLLLLLLVILLFYPYLQVSHFYSANRKWGEIASMLPRPQSYFLSDASYIWSFPGAKLFSEIPMRHEHQMFIGIIPMGLALLGVFVGSRIKNGANFILMTGMLIVAILLTINISGFSLWYLLHKLPLASAIRAITRLDQAFLFPVAYLSMIALDEFKKKYVWVVKVILLVLILLFIAEASMTSALTSSKTLWRDRVSSLEATLPKNIKPHSVLFFSQRAGPFYADELDAMWVALRHNFKTMNGYSGIYPPGPGYVTIYGKDCSVVSQRILSYLAFINKSNNVDLYQSLMSRVVPIGFNFCDPSLTSSLPSITKTEK
jgi:hypothetical protein